MNNNLTDAEIIKALEDWIKELKDDYKRLQLLDAPMDCFEESHVDNIRLLSNALDLINRQKAELEKNENIIRLADKTIETANAELSVANTNYDHIKQLWEEEKTKVALAKQKLIKACRNLQTAKAEIERLKKDSKDIDEFARNICKERLLQGKAIADFDSLRRYIEKQKAEAYKECIEKIKQRAEYCSYSVAVNTITDNVLKDLEGEQNCE